MAEWVNNISLTSTGDTLHAAEGHPPRRDRREREGEGEGSGISGGEDRSLFLDNSIDHGNTGHSEIGGFLPSQVAGRAARGAAADSADVTVRSSLVCDGTAAWPGDGNLCADPKLANAAGGDAPARPGSFKIKLQLANGKVISGTRRYRTCTPGVPSGPPKV